jgi:hypothetical protein
MSLKLKILGMGLLAMVATSAFAVMNASAVETGHFSSGTAHTIIKGEESGTNHRLHLTGSGLEGQIGCSTATYEGTASTAVVKSIEVTPTYSGCTTTNVDPPPHVTVTHNGCTYRFKVATGGTNGTADLVCPAGKAIEIHHPNCTITVTDEHTVNGVTTPTNQTIPGIHYITTSEPKHALTLGVDVEFDDTYHGGICIFLGTSNKKGFLKGSVTVRGFDTAGNQVDITTT